MFTRKLSSQQRILMLVFVCPLYFYCGSIIVSALIKFLIQECHVSMDYNMANVFLNFTLDLLLVISTVAVYFNSLKEQAIDFKKNIKVNLKYGCIIGPFLMYTLTIIGGLITMALNGADQSVNQTTVETLMHSHTIMMGLTAVILAPIFEELFFRTTIFGWLYGINPIFAHIVSGLIFGFVHVMGTVLSGNIMEMVQIFAYFFMGLALSYLYEKTNNIFVPIITHSINNFISVIILFI